MLEIAIGCIITTIIVVVFVRLRKPKIKSNEYQSALEQMRLMKEFVENPARIQRWKLIQGKCQFFINTYKNDKESKVPEIVNSADKKLEEWISSRLVEALAIEDDEYCRSAALDAVAEFMASVGQLKKARKIIDLITVEIIKDRAIEKYKEQKTLCSALN